MDLGLGEGKWLEKLVFLWLSNFNMRIYFSLRRLPASEMTAFVNNIKIL